MLPRARREVIVSEVKDDPGSRSWITMILRLRVYSYLAAVVWRNDEFNLRIDRCTLWIPMSVQSTISDCGIHCTCTWYVWHFAPTM